eukprot:9483611-Pyramimonas_sp.AAC.2
MLYVAVSTETGAWYLGKAQGKRERPINGPNMDQHGDPVNTLKPPSSRRVARNIDPDIKHGETQQRGHFALCQLHLARLIEFLDLKTYVSRYCIPRRNVQRPTRATKTSPKRDAHINGSVLSLAWTGNVRLIWYQEYNRIVSFATDSIKQMYV